MVLAFKGTKGLDADLKEGTVDTIKSKQADKGAKRGAGGWKRPVGDKVKFRLSGAVAIRGDVVTDVFNAVSQKFTLLQLKGDTILHEDVADALEETEQGSKHGGPEEDVVNNNSTAEVSRVVGVARSIKDLPFGLENAHHASIESGSVARTERHHAEAPLLVIGCKEGEFLLVAVADCDLMVASLVVEGDKKETTSRVAEVVDSVVAARNRILKRKSNLIQTAIRDTHTPDELVDVYDMFLMGFGSKDDRGTPGTKTFADPAVGFEDFELLHDNLALVRPIMRLLATDGRRGAGVDCEFEIQNWELNASSIEAVPVRLDDVDNSSTNFGGNVDADDEVLSKLGEIALALPYMDIGADVDERFRRMADGFTKLLEFENALVDVVGVVHWNILVNRLGSPDLRWYFDDESTSGDGGDGRQRRSARK
jgi:hypothetical protein